MSTQRDLETTSMSHELIGEPFGDYLLIKEIARGGMALVSLAEQKTSVGLKRRVVIKSVLPHMISNDDFVTMFVDEARLMMSFSHPHVAQVFEAGQLEGRHFIAMEYVHGVTLSEMIKAARQSGEHIPYEVAFGVALALAEALSYVHQRCDDYGNWLSIIHRDLKPSNVLVGYDGVVKLIDFGIAQAASKQHQTKTGVLKGTVGYLAPEQILDEPVDQRADVFTLGLLLYQTFLGRYPFPGRNDAQRLRALIQGEPLAPHSCRPDCPEPLARLLLKSLASSPSDRLYMRELVTELAQCAREMKLTPHFQVISDWVRGNLQPRVEDSHPEQLLRPALGRLQVAVESEEKPDPPTLVNQRDRAHLIEERLDELDPLFDGATLLDVPAQHQESPQAPQTPTISASPLNSLRAIEAPAERAPAVAIQGSNPERDLIATVPIELGAPELKAGMDALKADLESLEPPSSELFQASEEELAYTSLLDQRRFKGFRRRGGSERKSGSKSDLQRALIIGGLLIALAVFASFAYLLAS